MYLGVLPHVRDRRYELRFNSLILLLRGTIPYSVWRNRGVLKLLSQGFSIRRALHDEERLEP